MVSGASPFERSDVVELLCDAPTVLRRRAPDLVAAFERRGWPLPPSIDRVYSPARAVAERGDRPRHGFDAVLAMRDDESSEVLSWRPPSTLHEPDRP